MKKNRILHIAQSNGGVDRYLKSLLKHMDHNQYENILVCSQDYIAEEYDELADKVEQIEMQREIGTGDIKSVFKIRKLIKKYKPDIVYAHSSKAGAVARIADIGIHNKCVYNPHGWAFNMNCGEKKKKMYILIERLLSLFCNKIVCISEAEKESALKQHICSEKKLEVIVNGIDIEEYQKCDTKKVNRHTLGIPENAYVVGAVGRICEQKSPDVFIEAAALIKQKIPNAYFLLVGDILLAEDKTLKDQVIKLADKYGLSDCFKITGWVDRPQDYVNIFDAACLLSRWEGFGLVLPEYMVLKKPVVATNVDAIPNTVKHYKNGLLVEKDNYEDAANAVITLHDNPALSERLSMQGYKDACANFDTKRVAAQHNELFHNILKKPVAGSKLRDLTVRTAAAYSNTNTTN